MFVGIGLTPSQAVLSVGVVSIWGLVHTPLPGAVHVQANVSRYVPCFSTSSPRPKDKSGRVTHKGARGSQGGRQLQTRPVGEGTVTRDGRN